MKNILLLILISAEFTVCFGQLTVTVSDLHSLIGTTDSLWNYSSTDTSGLSSIVGNSGANRTWDISKRTYQQPVGSIIGYTSFPGGAPLANDPAFASCNVLDFVGTSSDTIWNYLALNDSGFYSYGNVIGQSVITISPRYPSYKFPLTYGSQWSGSYTATTTYNGTQVGTASVDYTDVVDGWGTVITPEGSFSCLRLKLQSNTVGGLSTTNYVFIGKDQTYATITTGNGIPEGVSYNKMAIITGIKRRLLTPASNFTLYQNYPNPFNPSTVIGFNLKENSTVRLSIFNALGQLVDVFDLGQMKAGSHSQSVNMSRLASGVYFYRVEAMASNGERLTATKKMVLVR